MAQEIEKNNYLMQRKWREHPAFDGETFSRMDAWGWIIENAAWKDGVVNVNGNPIPLTRGQLSFSIRFMAEKWKWGKSSVERFLKHLKKWDMINALGGTKQIIITVCNYDKYQLAPNYKRDTSGTQTEAIAGQVQDKGGTKKNKGGITDNTVNTNITPLTPPWLNEDLLHEFRKSRNAMKKPLTPNAEGLLIKKLAKIKAAGHDPNEALENAILGGWQSVYEPKTNQKPNQPIMEFRP